MGRLRLSLLFSVPKNAFETLSEEEGTQKKKKKREIQLIATGVLRYSNASAL